MARYTKTLVVPVEPATAAELRRIATTEERTLAAVVRRLLAAGLAKKARAEARQK